MRLRSLRRVECSGDRLALGENARRPFAERHFVGAVDETQAWLAAPRGDPLLVADNCDKLLRRVWRAVAHQAVEQEHVEHATRARVDPDRLEGIEVHQPYLYIFDA